MRTGLRILLCLLLAGLLLSMAWGAPVTGEEVRACAGERIQIPLCITENEGIMGFRIRVQYPRDLLYQPEVKPGSLTGTGLLDSNISPEGTIEVLWCGSSDVEGDGSLFILEFTVREDAREARGELLLTYTQEDTFNERWEDVLLKFSPVSIEIQGNAPSQSGTQGGDPTTGEEEKPTDSETGTETVAPTTEREETPSLSEPNTQPTDPAGNSQETPTQSGQSSPSTVPPTEGEGMWAGLQESSPSTDPAPPEETISASEPETQSGASGEETEASTAPAQGNASNGASPLKVFSEEEKKPGRMGLLLICLITGGVFGSICIVLWKRRK